MLADLTIQQIEPPADLRCAAGDHRVQPGDQHDGRDILFYQASGRGVDVVVCTKCLALANALARTKGKSDGR